MTRKSAAISVVAMLAAALALLVPAAFAANGGGGKGKGGGGSGTTSQSSPSSGCTQNAPSVTVENNWQWGSPGSWGLPGQQLDYQIRVTNNDAGCASSSFVISMSAPGGFAVSVPTNTVALKAPSSAYLWAYVTSPAAIADGNYPLTVTVQRAGTAGSAAAAASGTTSYRVYSSDSTAPTLFWENPWEGQAISGRSFNVTVSSSDDHAVKKIDLYIDGNYMSTKTCDNVTYICQLSYTWSTRRARGQHSATFKSTDWMGNVGVLTTNFTVS